VAVQTRRQKYVDERRRRHERSEGNFGGRRNKRRNRQNDRFPETKEHGETTHIPGSLPQPSFALRRLVRHETDDDDNVVHVAADQRLFSQYPLLAHEAGAAGLFNSARISDGRMFDRTHATTAASTYARDLQFKGAVPVLDENMNMMINSQLFSPETRTEWATANTVPGRRMARPFAVALNRPATLSMTKIKAMYVHGEEQPPGMGIIYTSKLHDCLYCVFRDALLTAHVLLCRLLQRRTRHDQRAICHGR
jgi:hypothetical protein